jgi:hypothetical protein
MTTLFRGVVTLVSVVAAFYFSFWMGGAILIVSLHAPMWTMLPVALAVAGAVGWYVWIHTASVHGVVGAAAMGAFVIGAIGFSAGFFGPILFMPGANQGPLLGIFITGPLGFVLGGIGGAIYWLLMRAHRE